MQGLQKSDAAIKNWWLRSGRASSGLDERNKVKAGHEGVMSTSLQGQNNRAPPARKQPRQSLLGAGNSAQSSREIKGKGRATSLQEPTSTKDLKRKRSALAERDDDNDDDDDDFSLEKTTPKRKRLSRDEQYQAQLKEALRNSMKQQ